MDTILRAAVVYLSLLLIFRISGKRSLSQITTFDFVLLLVISEAIQQGMITSDYSLTNAILLVMTLVGLDILLSLLSRRSSRVRRLIDGMPLVIIEDGRIRLDRMRWSRVNESDILSAARELQGLERLDQIKYAVIEKSGTITIVPKHLGGQ